MREMHRGNRHAQRALARSIAQGLRRSAGAAAIGLLVVPNAHATDECGVGANVTCVDTGNPYPNGISYVGNVTVTLAAFVRVSPISDQFVDSGGGFAVWQSPGTPSSSFIALIEAGALISSDRATQVGVAARTSAAQVTHHGEIAMTGNGASGINVSLRDTALAPTATIVTTGNIASTGADGIRVIADAVSVPAVVTIDNSGLVHASGNGDGIETIGSIDDVTIHQSGAVDGGRYGTMVDAFERVTFTNSGTIAGNIAGSVFAFALRQGTVANSQTGILRGLGTNGNPDDAAANAGLVSLAGSAPAGVRYDNQGLIQGAIGLRAAGQGQLFFNSGTIHGTGGYAIAFQGNDHVLTLQTGSELIGDVKTMAANTGTRVVLEGAGSEDSDFENISSLRMNGQTWTLGGEFATTAATADATRVDAGTLILTGRLANANGGVTIGSGGALQLGDGGVIAFDASPSPFNGGLRLASFNVGPLGIVNDGTLRFDHALPGLVFNTTITGSGVNAFAAGTTVLAGNSGAFSGTTTVSAGLIVEGVLGGTTQVAAGGALSGSGLLGATRIDDGGTLVGTQGNVLTMDTLVLDAGAHVGVRLGTPSGAALFGVTGNLTLDGTLEVTDVGGFGQGIYRLFDYGGALTDLGLAIGAAPAGVPQGGLSVQTSVANQVNLVSTSGEFLDFWDGNGTANDNTISGGSGIWNATDTRWANADGSVNGAARQGFVVFQGSAGTVTIDTGNGVVAASGLQFATDGYRVDGNSLQLVADETTIRVGDGTGAGAGYTATINAELAGDARLVKTDLGTLVLNGANTYAGGTEVRAGTLQVGADANLGAAIGDIVLDNARLATAASFTSGRTVSMAGQGGVIDTGADATLTLGGTVDGAGDLTKLGAGTLVLTGTNTYGGDTLVLDGALVGDSDSIRGNLASNGSTVFDQASDGMFAGAIGGSGTLRKTGSGRLTLGGPCLLAWAIDAGTLEASAAHFPGDAHIGADGTLQLDDTANVAYDAVLSGTGAFVKSGSGALSLSGDSSAFAGATTVRAGLLQLDGTLGGSVAILDGATLQGIGTVGTTTLHTGGLLAPGDGSAHTGTFTIAGDFVGAGGTVQIDAILAGDGSPVSLLHVTGDSAGIANLRVHHLAGAGAATRDGIRVVQVDGSSNARFTLLGRVVSGPYDYKLFQGSRSDPANGDWYLRSMLTIRPETGAYLANQAAAFGMFRHDMLDRHGVVDARVRIGGDGIGPGWVRAQTTTVDFLLSDAGLGIDQQATVVQLGADVYGWRDGDAAVFGVMLGSGRANATALSTQTGLGARGESRGEALGVYGTWFEHAEAPVGARIDTWLQYGRFDQRVQGTDLAREDYDARMLAASFEAGYGFQVVQRVNASVAIEPQAQVVLTRHDADPHVEQNGTIVEGSKEALITRLGALVSAHLERGGLTIAPFVSSNWLHEGGDTHTMTFDALPAAADVPADRHELKAGVQVQFASGWQLSAQWARQWGGGDYRQLGAQLGATYRW